MAQWGSYIATMRLLSLAIAVALPLLPVAAAFAQQVYGPAQGQPYSPLYLNQGLRPLNPIQPIPDPQREFVTPQFQPLDRRDLGVVNPDINRKRERKLYPWDGDIRLRRQKGELPVVPDVKSNR